MFVYRLRTGSSCATGLPRGMPSATYVSVLVRSHLRSLAPLPKEELLALKRSVAELGAAGVSIKSRGLPTGAPRRISLDAKTQGPC